MTGRRTSFVIATLALLFAAGVWFIVRSSSGPRGNSESSAGAVLESPADPLPLAKPDEATKAEQSGDDAARGVADSSLGAKILDDATLDPARDDEDKHAQRTKVIGRVVDEEGKPIVSARVFLSLKRTHAGASLDSAVNRERVKSCETDEGGRFGLVDVDCGVLRIAVRTPGYAALDPRDVGLPPNKELDLGELRMTRGVAIAGRVLDADLRPLEHAFLYLADSPLIGPVHRLGSSTESMLCMSDEAGHFENASVPPGKTTLRVHHQEFPDALFDVDCRIDQTHIDNLEFVLPRALTISGSILDFDARAMPSLSVIATTVDGLQLFKASKPEGATGEWLAGCKSAEVDPFGRFSVLGLEPGRAYSLHAKRQGNVATGADEEIQDRWAPATIAQAGAQDVEVCYRAGSSLVFRVVDRASGDELEHLNVRLSGMSPDQPLDEHGKPQTVFPGGKVAMLDLRARGAADPYEPGKERDEQAELTLTIDAPGHDSTTLERLRLAPGAQLDLGPVQLEGLAPLEVRVLDAANLAPLSGASVELTANFPESVPGRKSSVATTLANGLARLTSLPTPSSTLSITCPGYAAAQLAAPGSVRDGAQPVEVSLVLAARITASVRDSRGASVPAAEVLLRRENFRDRRSWSRTQRTDAQGVAVFSDIPEGIFSIVVKSRSEFSGAGDVITDESSASKVSVRSGDDVAVELKVTAFSALSGSLWRGREPLAGATLSFSSERLAFCDLGTDMEHFASVPRVRTDARGEFAGVQLAPGDWSLLIDQPANNVRTRRVVRVEKIATNVIIDVDDTQVTGNVSDPKGAPVEGARVQLFADRPGRRTDIRPSIGDFLVPQDDTRRAIVETTTDASGDYRLESVPPGVPLEMFFSRGRRAASILRLNVPQGRTLGDIDARLPEGGGVEIILVAPIAGNALHYGVRIVALKQPEGLELEGADFDGNNRAHFDDLPPGDWAVLVFVLDIAEQVVDRRKPQTILVKSGQVTEFTVGW